MTPITLQPPRMRAERKAERQNTVVDALRQRIVRGDLAPGERLPIRLDIEGEFNASAITVQRALDQLREEGFVVAQRRSGTYVVEEPPHLSHFALVFQSSPASPGWGQFWTALCNEAPQLEADCGCKILVFYDVDGHEDSLSYQQLIQSVRDYRLAGLIFVTAPDPQKVQPLFDAPHIARVAIMHDNLIPGLPAVNVDQLSFYDQALDFLAASGRSRVAFLKSVGTPATPPAGLEARGLRTKPHWTQRINLWTPETARGVVHLLMNPDQLERPDAIIVGDDNLLEPVAEGLIDAGVRVPEDVLLITHCNFPWPTHSSLPVHRLGFDTRQVLETCLEVMGYQSRGESPPPLTTLKAEFEDSNKVKASRKSGSSKEMVGRTPHPDTT